MMLPFRGRFWFENLETPHADGLKVSTLSDLAKEFYRLHEDEAPLSLGIEVYEQLFDLSGLDRNMTFYKVES